MATAFQSDAFQTDTFQIDTSGVFTADAVLLKTATGSFTADAYLTITQSGTFTADSYLLAVRSATFTANAVLFKTISATKTANAVLKKVTEATFTADAEMLPVGTYLFHADARLSRTLIEDSFTRLTATGDVGQPDIGKYNRSPEQFIDGFVDGGALVAPNNFGSNLFKIAPTNTAMSVRFDYLITDADGFGSYEVGGPSLPNGFFFRVAQVYVYNYGDGNWALGGGVDPEYNFVPNVGETWILKAQIDVSATGYFRAKTWMEDDPEPSAWQIDVGPSQFLLYGDIHLGNYLYISSGDTDPAWLDNLLIQQLELATPNDWFTADASLLKIQSQTFTADAVLAGTSSDFGFTADAVLRAFDGTYQWGFAADAVLAPNTLNWTFTANAWIVKRTSGTFTANASLVRRTSATFTADAYIRGRLEFSFTANAVLRRAALTTEDRKIRKTITFHVQQRRPVALSAFIPPREPDSKEQTDDKPGVPDVPCLPPCPGYPGGPGSAYGANGAVIRRTIVYCEGCGVYYYTHRNRMGLGTGTVEGHPGCTASHAGNLHMARIFADYTNRPTVDVEMKSKLLWDGSAPAGASIRVFGNVPQMPNMSDEGDFINWNADFENDIWNSGNYLGELSFRATNSGTVASTGNALQWDDTASSLTIRSSSLMSDFFRFEIGDTGQYYGAEFRAPNVPIKVGD